MIDFQNELSKEIDLVRLYLQKKKKVKIDLTFS